jgi:hypothetical protein
MKSQKLDDKEEDKRKYRKKYMKKYRSEHEEMNNKTRERSKKHNKERRLELLNLLSNNNPHCVKCGCNDIRLLEINHKNGGGGKELKKGKAASKFWRDIRMGIRKMDDLELLCRICNSCHYLELKYGKLPYKISYDKKEGGIVNAHL